MRGRKTIVNNMLKTPLNMLSHKNGHLHLTIKYKTNIMKIYLNTFASLVNRKSEESLIKAIHTIVEEHDAPFWYSRIRSGVRSFFAEGMNYSILESLVDKLASVVPTSTFQKNDCENSKQAVTKIMRMSFSGLDGKNLVRPTSKSIMFHGIELDVNPDALIIWLDSDGKKHVGAIKSKLKKSVFRQEEAVMISCMLKCYIHTLFPDDIVEDVLCICYDVFRNRFYGPMNYSKNLALAIEFAERIRIMGYYAA